MRSKHQRAYLDTDKGKACMIRGFYARYNKTKDWQKAWTKENHAAWTALVMERERLIAETGIDHDIDHIVPLNIGGPHHPANCRVITANANRSRPKDGSDL